MDSRKNLSLSFALLALSVLFAALPGRLAAATASPWAQALRQGLAEVDARYPGELGVFVKDLDSGESVSLRGEESWYLASGIKVPVAIAVMRSIERREFNLMTKLWLQASDYVDGAGRTNSLPPGSRVSVSYLLDQMLIYSDNTASDMLIRLVGLEQVNQVAQELAPEGFGAITTLADVRRHTYSNFHKTAFQLTSKDLLSLKQQRKGRARIERLAQILNVSVGEFGLSDLDSAFKAYYATDLNAAPLSAYATLLEALVQGKALSPESTEYLMSVLHRVKTGTRRVKAGLPNNVRFAHKTGTQHARACDFGIASSGPAAAPKRVIITVCSRGFGSLARTERAFMEVGKAVQASGALQAKPISY